MRVKNVTLEDLRSSSTATIDFEQVHLRPDAELRRDAYVATSCSCSRTRSTTHAPINRQLTITHSATSGLRRGPGAPAVMANARHDGDAPGGALLADGGLRPHPTAECRGTPMARRSRSGPAWPSSTFAACYALSRAVFLKDTGQKLAHLEKQLRSGPSLDELARRLEE